MPRRPDLEDDIYGATDIEEEAYEDGYDSEDSEPLEDHDEDPSRCKRLYLKIKEEEKHFRNYKERRRREEWSAVRKDPEAMVYVLFMSSMHLIVRIWQTDCFVGCNDGDSCSCVRSRHKGRERAGQRMPPKVLLRDIKTEKEHELTAERKLMSMLAMLTNYKVLFEKTASRGKKTILRFESASALGKKEGDDIRKHWELNFRDTREFYKQAYLAMKAGRGQRRPWDKLCKRQKELFWRVVDTSEAAIRWMQALRILNDYRFYKVRSHSRRESLRECKLDRMKYSALVRRIERRHKDPNVNWSASPRRGRGDREGRTSARTSARTSPRTSTSRMPEDKLSDSSGDGDYEDEYATRFRPRRPR